MSGFRRRIAACTMVLSMSGCTLVGLGVGGVIAGGKNSDPLVEQGYKPRTSVGKSMAVGAAIGLSLDIALVVLSVSQQSGSFGH